jgi:uncharacterized protein
MDLDAATGYLIYRLRSELKPSLTYHSADHTADVLEATKMLAEMEKVAQPSRTHLETAALFHDAGMLTRYANHETASASLARKVLPEFGYTTTDIREVVRLILVTRLPQHPNNLPEQVICDADLDYLGRHDFFINSFRLQLEWQLNRVKQTTLPEWLEIQVNFLTSHRYFTGSAIRLRQEKKMKNLEEIRSILIRNP